MRLRTLIRSAAPLVLAIPAAAQTGVDPDHKLSWSENCGWMNWADAGEPAGSQGVLLQAEFLSGFLWCENIGWINLGDGTPADGETYGNASGADFGVNMDASGRLSGLAWGENVGWINFAGGAMATPMNPARYDASDRRLHGFAWGENIGWINLDDPTHYVGVGGGCRVTCDYNEDGGGDNADITDLANAIASDTEPYPNHCKDFNQDGGADNADVTDLANAIASGTCP